MNPQKESLHQIKMRRVNRWRAAGFISVILLLLCLYPFLSDIQMQLHSSPPVKSYSTNLDTGQSQWATMYNEKRAERARLESGWATPKQKKLAYESLTSILKKESCLIFTVSFLEEMPATPKEIELARVANDSVEFHLPGHLVAAAATSPMTVFSKAFEDMKIAAATKNVAAQPQQVKAQISDIVIAPIETGFPAIVLNEEKKLADVAASDDQRDQEKTKRPTAKKFVVPRTFVKSVPEPTKTKTPKASTGVSSIVTISFVATAAASTLEEIPIAIERELATLAKSNFPDFSLITKLIADANPPSSKGAPKEQKEFSEKSTPVKGASLSFSPPPNQSDEFARLGKNGAAKYVEFLMKLNGIKDPRMLIAGTIIKIPADPTDKGSPMFDYEVQDGDCPWSIAMLVWGDLPSAGNSSMAKATMGGNGTP